MIWRFWMSEVSQRNKDKMMKKILTLFIACTTIQVGYSQPNFDMDDFNAKMRDVEWLYIYDAIAWWTSDSVYAASEDERKKLGAEWFCFQDENSLWHAAYGNFKGKHFELIFHYKVSSDYKVSRTYEPIDTAFADGYAKALVNTAGKINAIRKSTQINFNQFVRKNADKTYTVWYLPAFQPDATAIYGAEFIYTVDSTGTQILKEEKYQQELRGFKVDNPREIHLNYGAIDKPTLGGIFFVWYYKKYFTNIYLQTAKSNSTVAKRPDGAYYWIHVDKTGMKPSKEKKKHK